jgi:hypothetical protein
MDDRNSAASTKKANREADLSKAEKLKERLDALLREAAQVEVELSRADGSIRGVPHYSVIEGRAHELGRQLSRKVQQQQMNELAADHAQVAPCPTCATMCELTVRKRDMKSMDGDTAIQELVGHCPCCRRDFFPATRNTRL